MKKTQIESVHQKKEEGEAEQGRGGAAEPPAEKHMCGQDWFSRALNSTGSHVDGTWQSKTEEDVWRLQQEVSAASDSAS